MKDFPTLRFIDLFKGVFDRFGIDYPVMRKILQIKLTMDRRRVPTVFAQQNNQKKDTDDNKFLKSLWIYVLMGLIIIPFIIMDSNYFFQLSIVFGVIMFVVMSSMISDFSSVLLDLRDKNILSTKPVNSKTIATAKFLHICIYMFFLTAAVVTIPLVVSIFSQGFLFFLVFLGNVILIDLLIIVLTAMIYLAILKFFDGEKLKDIINYVQIGLSIGIVVGYQLLARSFDFMDVEIVFDPSWWQYLIPPIWYGATFDFIINGNNDLTITIFSVMSVMIPIIALFLYVKLMPSFEKHLQKLSNHAKGKKGVKTARRNKLGSLIFKSRKKEHFFTLQVS